MKYHVTFAVLVWNKHGSSTSVSESHIFEADSEDQSRAEAEAYSNRRLYGNEELIVDWRVDKIKEIEGLLPPINHQAWVEQLKNYGIVTKDNLMEIWFVNSVIAIWLQRNKEWVQYPEANFCQWCAHASKGEMEFTESRCAENVASGATCYRSILREKFRPFLRNILAGQYPALEELLTPIHFQGQYDDGWHRDVRLLDIVMEEIGRCHDWYANELHRQNKQN